MAKQDVESDMVRRLAELLDECQLTEIEYATQSVRLRVVRQPAQQTVFAGSTAAAAVPAPASAPATVNSTAPSAEHPGTVASPMVGTVYVAPEPGAAAFVQVGDTVRAGQTLLIIEAMKLMNPLPSPRAGRVTQILVRDAQPVEFGEPLLVIE